MLMLKLVPVVFTVQSFFTVVFIVQRLELLNRRLINAIYYYTAVYRVVRGCSQRGGMYKIAGSNGTDFVR